MVFALCFALCIRVALVFFRSRIFIAVPNVDFNLTAHTYPNDLFSTSPVAGAKAQAFIERAWTSSPAKVVALFIAEPLP